VLYVRLRKEHRKKVVAIWQLFLILCFHSLAYLVIFEQTGEESTLFFYACQVLFLIGYQVVFCLIYRGCSRLLLNHICMLLVLGLIMQTRLQVGKAWNQFMIAGLSAAVTLLVPLIMKYWIKVYRIRWLFGLFGIVALGLTFLTAQTEYGAKLSVSIGDISVQLSEIVKVSFVFFVAASFQKSVDNRQIIITTAIAALHVLVLVACKDLGGALILFTSYIFMLYVATKNAWYLAGGMAAGALACAAAYQLFSHVRVRIHTWLNPWSDVTNTGWQMAQSLFAIGSGGLLGVGLYEGMPGSIPIVLKDFIYAAICEEFGSLFALVLLLIYINCLYQFLKTAMDMTETFHRILCFGLAAVMAVQILLNVGGVTKFIPMTGVTLPLISYGGSSVLSTFLIFTVVQGCILMKENEEKKIEREKKQKAECRREAEA
jgi:cell division protein FtsW (lipid II flippase)